MSSSPTPSAIRLRITPDVKRALAIAKKRYPALSDPEILKVGLSSIAVLSDSGEPSEVTAIRQQSAYAVGTDYLADPDEDIYKLGAGKPVSF